MAELIDYHNEAAQKTWKRRGVFAAATGLVAAVVSKATEQRVMAGTDGDVVLGGLNTETTTTTITNITELGTGLAVSANSGMSTGLTASGTHFGVIGEASDVGVSGSAIGCGVSGSSLSTGVCGQRIGVNRWKAITRHERNDERSVFDGEAVRDRYQAPPWVPRKGGERRLDVGRGMDRQVHTAN